MLLFLLACRAEPAVLAPVAVAPATQSPAPATARVVFLGDSLTAGYGLSAEQAFPALVEAALDGAGVPVTVVNAGVSGDTTAGGLRRIDWVLQQNPDIVVIGLGANDMLRGLAPAEARANLRSIVEKARAKGAAVVLLGMRANPALGPGYVAEFNAIYPDIAREFDLPLLPFLLEGVAGDRTLNQVDGIHPTAEGQRLLAAAIRPVLEPVVRARRGP